MVFRRCYVVRALQRVVPLCFAFACAPSSDERADAAQQLFVVDSTPLVDIGNEADGPHALFSGPVIPALLSDGRIVVADGGSSELRFFDETGAWIRSVGRKGAGPGEFVSLGWLNVGLSDTLRAYDWGQLRVSVFSSDGTYQRAYMLGTEGGGGGLRPQAVLATGAIVASTQSIVEFNSAPGVRRDTSLLLLFDAQGRLLDSLGRYPGSEDWIDRTETTMSAQSRPFGKRLTISAKDSSVYIGNGDAHELTVLAASGNVRQTLRWPGAARPVTPQLIDAYIASTVSDAPLEQRASVAEALQRAPFPESLPAFATFVIAQDGTLWISRYVPKGSDERPTFDVIDTAGALLGAVEMPTRFSPSQVTRERVIGVWRDDDDVRHIRVYRLRRAAR